MPPEIYNDIHALVVDDDEFNREIALHHLKKTLGFPKSGEADDGSTALSYIEKNPNTDIILLDRMMPMNGLEFLGRIKGNSDYEDKIIILQTGKALPDDFEEVIKAGIIHALTKPYEDKHIANFLYPLAEEIRLRRYMKKAVDDILKMFPYRKKYIVWKKQETRL